MNRYFPVSLPWRFCLSEGEQLLVEDFTRSWVINGPKIVVSGPYWRVERRKGIILGSADYLHLRNTTTGELRSELGPKLYMLDAYEEVIEKLPATVLKDTQYIRVIDSDTGKLRIEIGPNRVYLNPTEKVVAPGIEQGLSLESGDYVRVRDIATGEVRNEIGPQLFFPELNDEVIEQLSATVLKDTQYIRIIDNDTGKLRIEIGPNRVYLNPTEKVVAPGIEESLSLGSGDYLHVKDIATGEIRNEIGPQLFFPKLNEEVVKQDSAIPLMKDQYIRLINLATGAISVERGEKRIYLQPDEIPLDKVQKTINVDEHTAVLVRDRETGVLELITEPQLYFPTSKQEIQEKRKSIPLADYETVVIRDQAGRFCFRKGIDQEKAFFLEPYCELVEFIWSKGVHKDERSLRVTHIDSRPKYMSYEFESRTKDNVELIVYINFFWQIIDVERMTKMTDDPTGDVCFHARSVVIQAVSQITLEQFLAEFNEIVRHAVVGMEKDFYEQRGVILHSVEVDSIRCVDSKTQETLSKIIQETANQISLIQKQVGENEVNEIKVKGEIAVEKIKDELVQLQNQNAQKEAMFEGASEALRIKRFLEELGDQLSLEEKISIFNILRKQDALKILSSCNAQVYFTPPDADLRIESRMNTSPIQI